MRTKRQRRQSDSAVIDLTPMIDVTFQLLIFFIICTRFAKTEDNLQVDLPKTDGPRSDVTPPKEQVTIYCVWDDSAQGCSYVVAMDARGRRPVEGSFARMDELVIYPSDPARVVVAKQERYKQVFDSLVAAIEAYAERSGAKIEKLEIAFAHDSTVGAASGTVPWMFVSMALDASVEVNGHREDEDLEPWTITFKFTDALGVYR